MYKPRTKIDMNSENTKSKLIYNAVALKAARQLPNSTWNIHGTLQIPFCDSRQILLNEFKKLSKSILQSAFQNKYRLVWILNISDGDAWLDSDGNQVKCFPYIHFLMGDAVNEIGESAIGLHESEKFMNLVRALWKHKIVKIKDYEAGLDDFYECLGISGRYEGYGLHSQVEMSDGLLTLVSDRSRRGDS
jgi:hypothetical protein